MTTSGTYNTLTSLNIASFVDEAFRRCRIDPQMVTGDQLWSSRLSLELLLQDWSNDGVQQFLMDEQEYVLSGDGETDIEFTTPDGTIDVLSMVYRNGEDQDIQIKPISRQDYLYINNKFIEGQPICYFVDKTTLPPVIKLWAVQNITGTSVVYTRLRRTQDAGAYTNTPDVSAIYIEALAAGLAARLAEKYADDQTEAKLIGRYEVAYRRAKDADRDRANYVMKPRLGRRFYYGV